MSCAGQFSFGKKRSGRKGSKRRGSRSSRRRSCAARAMRMHHRTGITLKSAWRKVKHSSKKCHKKRRHHRRSGRK